MAAAAPTQYESRDGTLLDRDSKGRVRSPITKRFMVPTARTFRALLESGDIREHAADSIVTIELGNPKARGKAKDRPFIRIQGKLSRAALDALQKLKKFDPLTPLAQRLTEAYGSLFANINSLGVLPIIRITSRTDLKQGYLDEEKRLAEDVETQPHVCSDFVKGGLPIMQTELKSEYRKEACALNLLLEACGSRIPKENRTVDQLAKLAEIPKKYKYKANLNELKTLSTLFNIKMTFVRTSGKLIRQYIPDDYKKKTRGCHFRVVVDGHHCWLATENTNRFDQIYGVRNIDEGGLAYDDDVKISWKPSDPTYYKYAVSTADEIIAAASTENRLPPLDAVDAALVAKNENAVSSENLELLIAELRKKNVYVGCLRVSNGIITSFKVSIGHRVSMKVSYVQYQDDQPEYPEVESVDQANLVCDYMMKLQKVLMPAGCASDYDANYKELDKDFPKPPMCGRLRTTNVPDECAEFDQSKAYSTVMRNITRLPIFSEETPMYKCATQETEPCCFYYVGVSQTDLFCAPTKQTFMYVDTVEFLRREGVKVDLLAIYRPIKINNCNMREFVEELYNDPDLTYQNKKSIMNITYGRAGRRKIVSTDGAIYENLNEANEHSHKLFELIDGLYCGYTERFVEFKTGFYHMSRIILENHRITLYRMAKAIGMKNILAVRTDAFYVHTEDAEAAQLALMADGFEFGKLSPTRSIPSITLSHGKAPPTNDYKYECQEYGRYEFADELTNEIVDYELSNEYCTEEVSELIKKSNAVFSGAYAGVGKTTTATKYCGFNDLSYKIATPYGRLRTRLNAEGHQAYTMDRFLGISRDPKIKFGPVSVEGVDVVIFDEVYLCDEIQLTRLGAYIKERPKLQIICTGDEYQLPPVGCMSVKTLAEARHNFFSTHFQVRINLKVIKRVTDEEERIKMRAISDYLRRPKKFDPLMLEQFDHVKFSDLTAEDAKHTHIVKTNPMRKRVNDTLEQLVNKPIAVGDLLLSIRSDSYEDYNGETVRKNLNSQDEYKVSDITDEYIEFRGKHTVRLAKDKYKDYMSRPYAITCNSAQGLSCGDIIYIHETDGWISNVWLRTAITRCGTFSGVRIVY